MSFQMYLFVITFRYHCAFPVHMPGGKIEKQGKLNRLDMQEVYHHYPFVRPAIDDIVYLAQGVDILPSGDKFKIFKMKGLEYQPFSDDFGPLNMSCITHFIEMVNQELDDIKDSVIIFCVDKGSRALTNAVFLLGCYHILALRRSADFVTGIFDWADHTLLETYRGVGSSAFNFDLQIIDCWRGLEKAMAAHWVLMTADGEYWGMINIDEYRHYDNPCNGDLHMVVPGRFLAFAGPIDLEGEADFLDDKSGFRTFSPNFYADLFEDLQVLLRIR